jgi:CheY-like chemotaxis protein
MPKRILIADDDEDIRRVIRWFIESRTTCKLCGEAVNGIDAIEKARTLNPDLILLDYSMPAMNGIETGAVLKAMLPNVPVILFTSQDKEPMRTVLLILCFTFASTTISSASNPRHETILGRVVAYSSSPACLNGNAYWSMVIRVQRSKGNRSEFIRVDFSLPCDKSPEWVSAKPSIQKFRLLRQKDCDSVLEEFMDTEPKQHSAIPIWRHPPGEGLDSLPFDQVIPCYRSIDLPLMPVV